MRFARCDAGEEKRCCRVIDQRAAGGCRFVERASAQPAVEAIIQAGDPKGQDAIIACRRRIDPQLGETLGEGIDGGIHDKR